MLQVGTDTVDVYRLDELLVLRVMYSERDVVTGSAAEVEDGLMTELKTAVVVMVLVVTLVATSAIVKSHSGILLVDIITYLFPQSQLL